MPKFVDLTGKIFGRLTVVSRAAGSPVAFYCRCSCDATIRKEPYKSGNLRAGLTRSCGCIKRERMKEHARTILKTTNMLDGDEALWRSAIHVCKSNAKRRNLSFELSREQFMDLVLAPCFFCGRDQTNSTRRRGHPDHVLRHNGIDRLDPSVGYIFENCVSCCDVCNRMKNNLDFGAFVIHVRRITERLSDLDVTGVATVFCKLKEGARR